MTSGAVNATKLLGEALELLGADRPLTFRDWQQAFRLVEAARHELDGDPLDKLSEDERRALFDPTMLGDSTNETKP